MNKILIIDLAKRNYQAENIPEAILENYLGGRGLGAYLLYKNVEAGVDPLSPENVLIFSCGPIQGTNAFFSSRAVLTTKSPLTGIYLYSVASGSFGHEVRKAGYTAIMIKGRSGEPIYVVGIFFSPPAASSRRK